MRIYTKREWEYIDCYKKVQKLADKIEKITGEKQTVSEWLREDSDCALPYRLMRELSDGL